MQLDKTGIIFSSIVGAKGASALPRLATLQNELMKHVLPAIPFLPVTSQNISIKNSDRAMDAELWKADPKLNASDQFFPFSFVGDDGQAYLLPYEPIININGKNTIVRRSVAKAKTSDGLALGGKIKERWTQDDYDITITGVLIGSIITGNVENCFPREDFEKLRDFMTAPRSLKVYCEPLQLLGINELVIEDFSFPFTKGENVQAYTIKAYSDFDYKLLLDLDD